MKKLFALILVLMAAALPLCVRAESPEPETLSAVWSEEQDGFLITFRRNGAEGELGLVIIYGEADDPRYGGSYQYIGETAGDPAEYLVNSSGLIPGETYTFLVCATPPDQQDFLLAGISAAVPVTGAQSPIRIDECSIPDLSLSALEQMRQELMGYMSGNDMESFAAAWDGHYKNSVAASFRSSDQVRVLLIAPDGNRSSFIAGDDPRYSIHDDYYDLGVQLAMNFVSPITIMSGQYTLRMYDWERKCLIGTWYFNVV